MRITCSSDSVTYRIVLDIQKMNFCNGYPEGDTPTKNYFLESDKRKVVISGSSYALGTGARLDSGTIASHLCQPDFVSTHESQD